MTNPEGDTLARKYRGAFIWLSAENQDYFWDDVNGVVGGDGFDSVDDCILDIDAAEAHREKYLRGPFAD
jgi:hypothetical protein